MQTNLVQQQVRCVCVLVIHLFIFYYLSSIVIIFLSFFLIHSFTHSFSHILLSILSFLLCCFPPHNLLILCLIYSFMLSLFTHFFVSSIHLMNHSLSFHLSVCQLNHIMAASANHLLGHQDFFSFLEFLYKSMVGCTSGMISIKNMYPW